MGAPTTSLSNEPLGSDWSKADFSGLGSLQGSMTEQEMFEGQGGVQPGALSTIQQSAPPPEPTNQNLADALNIPVEDLNVLLSDSTYFGDPDTSPVVEPPPAAPAVVEPPPAPPPPAPPPPPDLSNVLDTVASGFDQDALDRLTASVDTGAIGADLAPKIEAAQQDYVTDFQGNQYSGSEILNLAKQISGSLDVSKIGGAVYGTQGSSVGFDFNQAKKILGRDPTAADQVVLDMARFLRQKGVTDLSQIKTEDKIDSKPVYTVDGVKMTYDAFGNLRELTPDELSRIKASVSIGPEGEEVVTEVADIVTGTQVVGPDGQVIQLYGGNEGNVFGETYTGEGATDYVMEIDPETGLPKFYTTGRSTSDMEKIQMALTFASFIPGVAPFVQAVQGAYAASQGNPLAAAAAFAGAGGYTDAARILAAANAAKNGDLVSAAFSLAGTSYGKDVLATDLGGGFTVNDVVTAGKIVSGIDQGNYGMALSAAGDLMKSSDLKAAAAGLNVYNAITSGNPVAMLNALDDAKKVVEYIGGNTSAKDSITTVAPAGGNLGGGLKLPGTEGTGPSLTSGYGLSLSDERNIGLGTPEGDTASFKLFMQGQQLGLQGDELLNYVNERSQAIIASQSPGAKLDSFDFASSIDLNLGADAYTFARNRGSSEADALSFAGLVMSGKEKIPSELRLDANAKGVQEALERDRKTIESKSTFNDAFKTARNLFGPGMTFTWKGNSYSTDTAEENPALAAASQVSGSYDQRDVNFVKSSLLGSIEMTNLTGGNNTLNPADLSANDMNRYVDLYVSATPEQRAALLNGADKMTFQVIDRMLKDYSGTGKKLEGTTFTQPAGIGSISESDFVNTKQILKTGFENAGADLAALGVRGVQVIGNVLGLDTTQADRVQELLTDKKNTNMSKLAGDEKSVAAGLASGIQSGASWILGGPFASVATIGGVVANNSWIEGAKAGLTPAQNGMRTAVMTALEVAGEMLGIPGMKQIMKAIPITGDSSAILNSLKEKAGGFVNEQFAEILTTTGQMAADKWTSFGLGQNATFDDYMTGLRDTVIATTAAVGSAGTMGSVAGNIREASKIGPLSAQTDLTDIPGASSLSQLSSDARSALRTTDNVSETAGLTVSTLMESGMDQGTALTLTNSAVGEMALGNLTNSINFNDISQTIGTDQDGSPVTVSDAIGNLLTGSKTDLDIDANTVVGIDFSGSPITFGNVANQVQAATGLTITSFSTPDGGKVVESTNQNTGEVSTTISQGGVDTTTTSNANTGVTTEKTVDTNTGVTNVTSSDAGTVTESTVGASGNVVSTSVNQDAGSQTNTSVNADTGTITSTETSPTSQSQTNVDISAGVVSNVTAANNSVTQTETNANTGITTATSVNTATNTATNTNVNTNTNTATSTSTSTNTNSQTEVTANTATANITNTANNTETNVNINTQTGVATNTAVNNNTNTTTQTAVNTNTNTVVTTVVDNTTGQVVQTSSTPITSIPTTEIEKIVNPGKTISNTTQPAKNALPFALQAAIDLNPKIKSDFDNLLTKGFKGFRSPLDDFLTQVDEDYAQKIAEQEAAEDAKRKQEEEMKRYFNYGREQEIDDILRGPEVEALSESFDFLGQFPERAAKSGGLMTPLMAKGGNPPAVHYAGKPRMDFRKGAHVAGPGDGQSDDIPAMLADGEYVIDAEIVAALGNGSTKAGSELLDMFREEIRRHKRGGPLHTIPPKSKSPLEYLSMARKRAKKK